MSSIKLVENEFASLFYYPDNKIVHHIFHKAIGGKQFREVLDKGAETLAAHQANKWLSDDRANSALSPEDTEWSKTNWFPRALSCGWKYWALVVPEDQLARINMKEFVDEYFARGLRIGLFTTPEEALQWLQEIKE